MAYTETRAYFNLFPRALNGAKQKVAWWKNRNQCLHTGYWNSHIVR